MSGVVGRCAGVNRVCTGLVVRSPRPTPSSGIRLTARIFHLKVYPKSWAFSGVAAPAWWEPRTRNAHTTRHIAPLDSARHLYARPNPPFVISHVHGETDTKRQPHSLGLKVYFRAQGAPSPFRRHVLTCGIRSLNQDAHVAAGREKDAWRSNTSRGLTSTHHKLRGHSSGVA